MMQRRVVVEPEAERELLAARDWYSDRSDGLGQVFVEAVDEAMTRVATMPDACSPVPGVSPELGVRRAFVKRFPFSVVFVELGGMLVVVAVAHQRRRPGYWLGRLAETDD